jgi:mono/diheme cytochrome c family protein
VVNLLLFILEWICMKYLVLPIGLAVMVFAAPVGKAEEALTFERAVRPILKAHCFRCHGEGEKMRGGLDVRLRRFLVAGGDLGPAVVPGKPGESLLLERIRAGQMPPGKEAKRLSAGEIGLIERWIATGARTSRPEPEKIGAGAFFTEEERNFWSFQPIRRPPVPAPTHADRVRTPIDAFLLQRLEEEGASFAPNADRWTLLRRVHFDLIGLPPSPEEAERFLHDDSPDAYEKLVDRLLSSPHYGERWGRHWLDVAGYADSYGYTPADPVREHAFHYRDYVIRSFNADKPFDQFIREQLAGDEMVPPPHKNLTPEQAEKLIATGFLTMAPNPLATNGGDVRMGHDIWISESLKIVSTSLLGLSVGCAQCHDHRYDPITQEDYYRFRAIFEPAFNLGAWRVPRRRLISLYTEADRKKVAEAEAEAKKVEEQRDRLIQEGVERVLQRELARVPKEFHEALRKARATPVRMRTREQRRLLVKFPRLNFNDRMLRVYDRKGYAEIEKLTNEAARIRATAPREQFIQAMAEVPGQVPSTFLHFRGDYQQPRQELLPAELTILQRDSEPAISRNDPSLPTTGRRLAYARHLTDGTHPLVARVLVNHIWMHHFGKGLCATPADLGLQGDRPSHPELLDWLAKEFMEGGWSLKKLHRLIMTSTAYRQALRRDPKLIEIDPDNRLLGGFQVRRLEAEILRDSILAVSGKLNRKQFGPPVPVMRDPAGEIVPGIEKTNAGIPLPPEPLNGEEFRRSICMQVRRSKPLTILEAFDAPRMEPNCEARTSSTVATQSLMLMNNAFIVKQSRFFASRIESEAGSDPQAQVVRAWKLAFAREPEPEELSDALAFLEARTEHFRKVGPAVAKAKPRPRNQGANRFRERVGPAAIVLGEPEFEALAVLCQTLLSSNEFLYID